MFVERRNFLESLNSFLDYDTNQTRCLRTSKIRSLSDRFQDNGQCWTWIFLVFSRNDTNQNSSTGVPSMEPGKEKTTEISDRSIRWNLDGTIESNWTEVVEQFDQMNLREPLLRGIYGYGFERPSAIQQRAIKPCILGSYFCTLFPCIIITLFRSWCHCPSTIGYWQNSNICYLNFTTTRPGFQRLSSTYSSTYSRIGSTSKYRPILGTASYHSCLE